MFCTFARATGSGGGDGGVACDAHTFRKRFNAVVQLNVDEEFLAQIEEIPLWQ